MRTVFVAGTLVLAALGAACGESATAKDWSPAGLDGNNISYLVVSESNPLLVFAGATSGGADKGFFRSRDGGATWAKIAGLASLAASGLAVHPKLGTVLANPGATGLFRSGDGGDTWTAATGGPANLSGLAFDPVKNTAWAVSSLEGVFRSEDGGASWTKTTSNGLPVNQFQLGPLATDGSRLYLGSEGRGVYVSSDAGESWTASTSGLPSGGGADDTVIGLATSASRAGVVFLSTQGAGIYRSVDAAATWTRLDTAGHRPRYGALRIDPRASATIYASVDDAAGGEGGVLLSATDGTSWTPLPGPIGVYSVDATPGTILAGTIGKGVWSHPR